MLPEKCDDDQGQNAFEQFCAERFTICPRGSQSSRPQSDRPGGIGINGWNTGKKKRGKSKEPATSCDRIHGATRHSGEEKQDGMVRAHSIF